MRRIAGVATFCLLLSASSLTSGDTAGDGRLWRFAWPGNLLGVAGSVLVVEQYSPETRKQRFVTVDPRTGRERATVGGWRSSDGRGEEQLGFPFLLGPLLGGTLYPSYGGVVLLDQTTDEVRLRMNAREAAYLTTLSLNGRVVGAASKDITLLAACRGRDECGMELRAVETRSGRSRWRWAPGEGHSALFVTADARRAFVYADGKLRAFDLESGRSLWTRPSPICDGEVCDGLSDFLIAASGEYVAMTVAGRLAVHAASSGDLLSRTQLGFNFPRQLLVAASRVYLATDAGLICRDVQAQELWHLPFKGELGDMQIRGDVLYLAAAGVVRAIDAAKGTVRWAYGGDRFALWGDSHTPGAVIIGEDGKDLVAYPAEAPPGGARDVAVRGRVKVRPSQGTSMAIRPQDVRVLVAGEAASPDANGRYEARVHLSGGRIAISAKGCKQSVGPLYLPLDGRTELQQDIEIQDDCSD